MVHNISVWAGVLLAATYVACFPQLKPIYMPTVQRRENSNNSFAVFNGTSTIFNGSSLASSNDPKWKQVNCGTPDIGDPGKDPSTRWDAADTGDALKAASDAWAQVVNSSQGTTLTYSQSVMHFFNLPEGWNCSDIGEFGSCSSTEGLSCDESNQPAGWLIAQSFVNLHNLHANLYQSINDALNIVQGNIGTVSSTFSPQPPDNSLFFQNLLNGFGFFLGGVNSAIFNFYIKEVKTFSDATYDVLKTQANNAINGAVTIGNRYIRGAGDPLGTQNDLSTDVTNYASALLAAQAEYVSDLFSGTADSITAVEGLTDKGSFIAVNNRKGLFDITNEIQKLLYGFMIPAGWTNSPEHLRPIIMQSNDACDNTKAVDSIKLNLKDDDAKKTEVCLNDKAHYVVNAVADEDAKNDCVILGFHGPNPQCTTQLRFKPLPGGDTDTLNGSNYGGIILFDIVASVYNAFVKNNNQNGYQIPDPSQLSPGDDETLLFEKGVQEPGVVQGIPYCTFDKLEALQDWGRDSRKDFPC